MRKKNNPNYGRSVQINLTDTSNVIRFKMRLAARDGLMIDDRRRFQKMEE